MKISIIILLHIAWLYPMSLFSQSFEFAGTNPFGIQMFNEEDSARFAIKYFFTDQDADGDLDLILYGLDESDTIGPTLVSRLRYFFEFQENVGDKKNPMFAPREKPFESFDFPGVFGFALPSIGELNGDNKFDVLISTEVDVYFLQHPLIFFQNSENIFDKHRCEEWELDPLAPNSLFFPELTDLDMDGDQDLLLSGYYGKNHAGEENTNAIIYAKNIGSPSAPDFLGWFENPYGLQVDSTPMVFSAGDFDLDNDMDLLGMSLSNEEGANFFYFRNEPAEDGKPHFGDPVNLPTGFPQAKHEGDNYIFPNIVDIDGDGDLDIFFLHQEETEDATTLTLDLYENILCNLDNTIVFEGNLLRAVAGSGVTVQWFDCESGIDIPGASSASFQPTASGLFGAHIKDEGGCTVDSECISVTITKTRETEFSKYIELFPNPAYDFVFITNTSSYSLNRIRIHDHNGKIIMRGNAESKVDIKHLLNGVYFVSMDLEGLKYPVIKKLMVLR